MSHDYFKFKLFTVRQSRSAMKVGTDGIILGSWAHVEAGRLKILDVGTGTGLIALMLAQRSELSEVEAVEIDSEAAQEAADNFAASPFSERLRVCNMSFQEFAAARGEKYDLIVSNPPYFNGTYKSIDAQRTAARHKELLPSSDLIDGVKSLLSEDGGRFVAIFPYSDAAVFIAKAASSGLYCNRLMEVLPIEGKRPIRIVAEFSMVNSGEVTPERLVITLSHNVYTEDYKSLTRDFYLRF